MASLFTSHDSETNVSPPSSGSSSKRATVRANYSASTFGLSDEHRDSIGGSDMRSKAWQQKYGKEPQNTLPNSKFEISGVGQPLSNEEAPNDYRTSRSEVSGVGRPLSNGKYDERSTQRLSERNTINKFQPHTATRLKSSVALAKNILTDANISTGELHSLEINNETQPDLYRRQYKNYSLGTSNRTTSAQNYGEGGDFVRDKEINAENILRQKITDLVERGRLNRTASQTFGLSHSVSSYSPRRQLSAPGRSSKLDHHGFGQFTTMTTYPAIVSPAASTDTEVKTSAVMSTSQILPTETSNRELFLSTQWHSLMADLKLGNTNVDSLQLPVTTSTIRRSPIDRPGSNASHLRTSILKSGAVSNQPSVSSVRFIDINEAVEANNNDERDEKAMSETSDAYIQKDSFSEKDSGHGCYGSSILEQVIHDPTLFGKLHQRNRSLQKKTDQFLLEVLRQSQISDIDSIREVISGRSFENDVENYYASSVWLDNYARNFPAIKPSGDLKFRRSRSQSENFRGSSQNLPLSEVIAAYHAHETPIELVKLKRQALRLEELKLLKHHLDSQWEHYDDILEAEQTET